MTKEIARKSLDYLSNNAIKDKTGEFSVIFFGGEPFLQPAIMQELFEYGNKIAEEKKLHFSVTIITNATILTERIDMLLRTYMKKCNIHLQLSVDGVQDVHDEYRVTRDGNGSFHMVEKNIPKFLDIFKDNHSQLNIHGCINKKTMSRLYENYKFFRETLGFERVWFKTVTTEEWDTNDVTIYHEQMSLIYNDIVAKIKKDNNSKEVYGYAPLDRCLNTGKRPNKPCGCGDNFVTITGDGEIYPCHQFYFNDPEKSTKIGDIWTGIDEGKRKIFLNFDSDDLCDPSCKNTQCYKCIAENWQHNGSILSQVKGIYCKLSSVEKHFQNKLIKEVEHMGLLNKQDQNNCARGNNPNNPACLCDSRGGDNPLERLIKDPCEDGNTQEDKDEIIAMSLHEILKRLSDIEKVQSVILNKVI